MFHETKINKLRSELTPFPANIFADDQLWLTDHLLPLLSINLGILRPELSGTVIHMLCPMEPYDGYIGDDTEPFHNEFSAANWFALQLTEDNRYRFLGKKEYFRSPESPDEREHVAEMEESYARARAYFEKHGRLACYSRYGDGEARETEWLDNLGGDFWSGNWTNGADVPSAFTLIDDSDTDHIELTYRGNPFFPVADVAAYNYCASGADSILLFYEPKSRTALFTFDWT